MAFRRLPVDLCKRVAAGGDSWIFALMFEVDDHEYQLGKPKPLRYYTSRYPASRSRISRFLTERQIELEARDNGVTKSSQARDKVPNENNNLGVEAGQVRDSGVTTARQQVLRETETETDKRKKTLCPDPLPSEMTEALLNRIRLRHPGEKRSAHRGRLEAAVESLRLKREKSYDWTRRIWGYLHNVDASDAKKAGDPHPNSWRDLEKFEAGAAARSAETTAEVEKEYGNREENLKKFKNFPPMPENFGQMPR